MTDSDAMEIVRSFCAAWETGTLDDIVGFLTDDAVYHNIPMDPIVGVASIRTVIQAFSTGVDSVEFDVLAIAASGATVLTERVDIFRYPTGEIRLPVMGAFEVDGTGKISAWRDYFDLGQYRSAQAALTAPVTE